MSTARRNIRRALSETHAGPLDVSPLKETYAEVLQAQQTAAMALDAEAASVEVQARPAVARNNLDFRDFSLGSKAIDNPYVEQLRQDTHALVKSGLVDPSDLKEVGVRVLNFVDGESKAYQRDDEGTALEPLLKELEDADGVRKSSHFIGGDFGALTINGVQAESFYPSDKIGQHEALKAVYLHELGHAAVRPEEVQHRLLQVSAADTSASLPEDVSNAAIRLIDNPAANAYFKAHDGSSYTVVASEMYADAFMMAAKQHLDGESAAKEHLALSLEVREKGHQEQLNEMGPEGTLISGHNTVHALKAYERALESGEAATALREGRGLDVVDKVAYQAFVAEFVEKTAANLNVHHLDDNGVPVPGLPPGVTNEQVVTAHVRGELEDPGSGFTLLMPKGLTEELKAEGVTMEPGATRANEALSGKVDFRESVPSVPGFEAFVSSASELRVRDAQSDAQTTYRFGSPVETYLEQSGKSAPGSLAVETHAHYKDNYYQHLHNNMAELGSKAVEHHHNALAAPPPTKAQLEGAREKSSEFGGQAQDREAHAVVAETDKGSSAHQSAEESGAGGNLSDADRSSKSSAGEKSAAEPAMAAEMELGD